MKAFFDFLPVLLFFLSYIFFEDIPYIYIQEINNFFALSLSAEKSDSIYFATFILMFSYTLQVISLYVMNKVEKIHIFSLIIILLVGFITLSLKNPIFIKLKPSIIYFGFSIFFLINMLIFKGNIVKKIMGKQVSLDDKHWGLIYVSWIIFFIFSGLLNLYVAYTMDEETWVNFKFYILGIVFPVLFIIGNGLYIGMNSKNQ
ncbi:MAG: septation protein IspZ [Pseudomonadota bacterium]|nr:septation protein IspZ [Pseudomonadota bacterium]